MMDYKYIYGQTPIEQDEKKGLKVPISTMEELNQIEELNIIEGVKWATKKRIIHNNNIFSEKFILNLHKKMFGHVWKWAGNYRESNKNIGVDKTIIRQELFKLLSDVEYWLEEGMYSVNELAIVFHHRLVKIHLFPNGNGRHARLIADLIILKNNGMKLQWSGMNLRNENDLRSAYINALKKADYLDYEDLISFATGKS